VSCGSCYQCRRHQGNVCARAELIGRDRDGALSEVIAAPVANIYPLPDAITDHVAPLVQVVTVCVHAQRQTPLFPQASVLIFGLGVTGLLHVQLARTRGASPIIGVTRSEFKRSLAEELGADLALHPRDPDLPGKVAAATDGHGPDVVIECVGKVETLGRCIELARIGGHLTLFGTITERQGSLPYYQLYYKELSISNPRAARPEDFPDSIGLVESGAIRLEPLMSRTFPLEAAREAIEAAMDGRALKVTLNLAGTT
jgi:threonine dehydrogenase-like Zn-dependent dehydrogenase